MFVTIVTSERPSPDAPATVETAKAWAAATGHDPSRVLAADLWSKTVPEHRLYSPEGHTLFVHRGTMPAEAMVSVLGERAAEWRRW